MGMAGAYAWPKELRLPLTVEKDMDLTCWICGRDKTDMTFTWRLDGRRTVAGVHAVCVEIISEEQPTVSVTVSREILLKNEGVDIEEWEKEEVTAVDEEVISMEELVREYVNEED